MNKRFKVTTREGKTAEGEIIVTYSAGVDGAVLVFIDTKFEPDGSDGGPGLRVLLNDEPVFQGVGYLGDPETG